MVMVASDSKWFRAIGRTAALAALLLLAALPAEAQTYDVKVNPKLHDLDVKVEQLATTGVLVMKLTNKTKQKVRCDLRFEASPQAPLRKTVFVDPGKTGQTEYRAQRKWFDVEVDVECQAVQPKS